MGFGGASTVHVSVMVVAQCIIYSSLEGYPGYPASIVKLVLLISLAFELCVLHMTFDSRNVC